MSVMQDSHSISQVVAGMAVAGISWYTVVSLLRDHHHLSLEATTPIGTKMPALLVSPFPRGKTTAFENHGYFWSTIGCVASQEGDYVAVSVSIIVRHCYISQILLSTINWLILQPHLAGSTWHNGQYLTGTNIAAARQTLPIYQVFYLTATSHPAIPKQLVSATLCVKLTFVS